MSVTSVAHGSQSAVIDTEHTLDTQTAAGVYILVVDLVAMSNVDTVELRIYTKAVHDGSSRLAYLSTFSRIQPEPIIYSIPVPIDTEIISTLKQTAGTGAKAITAFATNEGGASTKVTSAGHALANSDQVTIAGTTNYNGTHTVSGVAGNDYVIDVAYVSDDATGTGVKVINYPWNLLKL
jgi:hypothetical protein